MTRQPAANRAVVIPVAKGLELIGYGRDEKRAARFAIWSPNLNRAYGGLALSWESKDTNRVNYSLRFPELHAHHLAKVLPALAIHAFANERKGLKRLVTRMDSTAEDHSDVYLQAITEAGFRLSRINNRLSLLTYELVRDSLDESGQLVPGLRRPPVRVDVPANNGIANSYLEMSNLPPSTYEAISVIEK